MTGLGQERTARLGQTPLPDTVQGWSKTYFLSVPSMVVRGYDLRKPGGAIWEMSVFWLPVPGDRRFAAAPIKPAPTRALMLVDAANACYFH